MRDYYSKKKSIGGKKESCETEKEKGRLLLARYAVLQTGARIYVIVARYRYDCPPRNSHAAEWILSGCTIERRPDMTGTCTARHKGAGEDASRLPAGAT